MGEGSHALATDSGVVKAEPISEGELADIERVWNDSQT